MNIYFKKLYSSTFIFIPKDINYNIRIDSIWAFVENTTKKLFMRTVLIRNFTEKFVMTTMGVYRTTVEIYRN